MTAGGPRPSTLARVVSIATLCASPLALILIWGSVAFNVRPTNGALYGDLEGYAPDASGAQGLRLDGAFVTQTSTFEVEAYPLDSRIDLAYHLGADVLHLVGALMVLLAVVTAIGVLRRRPGSRAVVGVLLVTAGVCAAAGLTIVRAREWAMRAVIDQYDLPTDAGQAREAGVDFYVASDQFVDNYAWTWGFLAGAVVALAAAAYVLHVRRQLVRAADAIAAVANQGR